MHLLSMIVVLISELGEILYIPNALLGLMLVRFLMKQIFICYTIFYFLSFRVPSSAVLPETTNNTEDKKFYDYWIPIKSFDLLSFDTR